ncbi:MAG TPA: sulfotransferase family 2 domain-containing protein [Phycisphaerae bacterium]|nr:sulfotransferase family 2 domain-containing protein [Phycisphaerae bacterium]
MIIMHPHQMVFIGTPKAACNAMYAWLERNLDGLRESFHRRDVPDEAKDYWRFTVVRNPYARAVSMWWSLTGQGGAKEYPATESLRREEGDTSLPAFLRWVLRRWPEYVCEGLPDGWIGPQVAWLRPAEPVGFCLHMESLEDELTSMLQWCVEKDEPWPSIERLNETRAQYGPWEKHMTAEVVELIDAWAGEDFERFGYERRAGHSGGRGPAREGAAVGA